MAGSTPTLSATRPNFVIGNAPRTLPRTRAPGMTDVAFSIFKSFSFLERFKLQTRWEMFNALNTVNLNNPNTSFSPNAAGVNTNANFGRIFGSEGRAPHATRSAPGLLGVSSTSSQPSGAASTAALLA
jgi:hypothetical protein